MFHATKSLHVTCSLLLLALAGASYAGESEEERKAKQAELDAACEAARDVKLTALRARLTEECVEKKSPRPDRAACERFYSDHGITTPYQAGLFYDLPECVSAHDYKNSYRRSGK